MKPLGLHLLSEGPGSRPHLTIPTLFLGAKARAGLCSRGIFGQGWKTGFIFPMFNEMRRLIPLLALLAVATPFTQTTSEVQANKQLINDFFNFRGALEERAKRFMSDTYRQHNPRFLKMDTYTGQHGWEAWVAANEEAQKRGNLQLVALGGIPLRDP